MFYKNKFFILIKTKNILIAIKFSRTTDCIKHLDFTRFVCRRRVIFPVAPLH